MEKVASRVNIILHDDGFKLFKFKHIKEINILNYDITVKSPAELCELHNSIPFEGVEVDMGDYIPDEELSTDELIERHFDLYKLICEKISRPITGGAQ